MYTNAKGQIIEDQSPYKGADGTKYPWNFPKDKIAELTPVQETQKPKEGIITGFSVSNGKQVWATREKTIEEKNAPILSKIRELEATVTQRRIRDAFLTEEGRAWMEGVDALISGHRSNLIKQKSTEK